MAKQAAGEASENVEPTEHRAVLVGWTHHGLGSSIDLRIQSAVSQKALDDRHVDSHHFLMTQNQAFLLAKYLLDATGQTMPQKRRVPLWRKLTGGRNK